MASLDVAKEETVASGDLNSVAVHKPERAVVEKIHALKLRHMAADERRRHAEALVPATAVSSVSDTQLMDMARELKQVKTSLAAEKATVEKMAGELAKAETTIAGLVHANKNTRDNVSVDFADLNEASAAANGQLDPSRTAKKGSEKVALRTEPKLQNSETVEEPHSAGGLKGSVGTTQTAHRQADGGAEKHEISLARKQFNAAIQREREEAKMELEALQQRYEVSEQNLAAARKEMSHLKALAPAREAAEAGAALAEEQEKKALQAEVAKLKEALRVSKEERAEVDAQSKGIKERIQAFETARSTSSPTATKERTAAAEKIAGLKARVAAAEGEVASSKKVAETTQRELDLVSKDRAQLKAEVEKRERELKQLDQRMAQVVTEGEGRVTSSQEEAEHLRVQLVRMHGAAAEEANQLKNEVQRVAREKDVVAAKLEGVQEKLSLMAAAEAHYMEEVAGSRAVINDRVEECEGLKRRLGEVGDARRVEEARVRQKESEVAGLMQQLSALTHAQELRDQEIHRLSQVAAEEESQLARLRKELQSVVAERRQREESLSAEKQRSQHTLQTLATKQEEVKKLQTVLAKQEQEGELQKRSLESKHEQLLGQWREADRLSKKAGREVEEVKRTLERRIGLANSEVTKARQVAEQEKAQRVRDKVAHQEKMRGVLKEATEIRRLVGSLAEEVAALKESGSPESVHRQLARAASVTGSSQATPLLASLNRFWQNGRQETHLPLQGGVGGEKPSPEVGEAEAKGGRRKGKKGGGRKVGGKGEQSLRTTKAAASQQQGEEEWESLVVPANRMHPGWLTSLQLADLAKVVAGGALAVLVQRLAGGLL